MKVSFIGTGDMGGPMAHNIAKAGFDLCVCDLRPEALDIARAYGARTTSSLAQAVQDADVIATCVRFQDQVEELFLGKNGIIALGRAGQIAIMHSTVRPALVHEIAAAAKARGMTLVDAPVSGGRDRSIAGTLTVIVGAEDAEFKIVEPLFTAVGKDVVRVGRAGDAQVVKLGNNLMALSNQLVIMEAVRFCAAQGVSRDQLFKVAQTSTGGSWGVSNFDFFDRYPVHHTLKGSPELPYSLAKDLRAAAAVAIANETAMPITAMCSQLFPSYFKERWNNPEGWDKAR
ncbi:MAG: NAD(P)-dependent oxidoreductase [Burkholderiaceae bacterium]|nr:NAD(P)-dependent oxidoreductase [Burkholderiaceae bacterium]MDP1968633.1 NAD(P)-dependent oxidoreductase [Burkholderiaceae bacterium]